MKEIEICNLLDTNNTIAKELFLKCTYPWEVLNKINGYVLTLGNNLSKDEYNKTYDNNKKPIWIHKTAIIGNFVTIEGPTIIDKEANIRHCAYIRENSIIGEKCIIGNSSEIKNSILFNESKVPHYNYVGDSILGYKSHLGAGVKLSNFKSDGSNININYNNQRIDTMLNKLGAILGDNVEIGCNSVTNPGTIICKNSTIYPLLNVRGVINSNTILKSTNPFIIIEKRG
jgi:NDP-sugar pyrophosphorylase family protein